VNNLLCCFFLQPGTGSDHHGHDWQNPAFAYPEAEVGARDIAHHGAVAQHGGQVGGPPKYRRDEQPNKPTVFHEALKQALKADARRPKHQRRTAKAL